MKRKRLLVTAAAVVGLVAVFGWLDLSSPSQCSGTPTKGDLQVGHISISRIVEREEL